MGEMLAAIEQVDPAADPGPVSCLGELLAFGDVNVIEVFTMPI
jgi:hypothetical protein